MNIDYNKTCMHFCIYYLCYNLSPFKRLLKASFNCIQNKIEKPPGFTNIYPNITILESVEKLTKTKIIHTGGSVNYIKP